MTADLRQIRWNSSEIPLTEAEEYSVWSNHVNLMFLYPSEFYSAYDRIQNSEIFSVGKTHYARTRIANGGDANMESQEKTFPVNREISYESTCDTSSLCLPYSFAPQCSPFSFEDVFVHQRSSSQVSCFPWCFYPRMMRHVVINAKHGNENKWYPDCGSTRTNGTNVKSRTQESEFFSRIMEKKKNPSPFLSSPLYHIAVEDANEVDAVCRLAALLRKRNEKKGTKRQNSCQSCDLYGKEFRMHSMPSLLNRASLISSTLGNGDLKVEEKQAEFVNDATELLVHIRNENSLTSELHHQLERSKLIFSQISDRSAIHET